MALIFEGETIVISPLMQAQVEAFKKRGKFVDGKTKLLSVAPKRFRKKFVLEITQNLFRFKNY